MRESVGVESFPRPQCGWRSEPRRYWTPRRDVQHQLPPLAPPSSSVARFEMTSLVFMLVEVPEPVWKMSTGNSASRRPSTTFGGGANDGVSAGLLVE